MTVPSSDGILAADPPGAEGRVDLAFAIEPEDFPGRGPFKLVLQARCRTAGLTSRWDLDLPHIPFSFEFDPLLAVEALLAPADDARAAAIARAVRLEPSGAERLLDLNDRFALRDPPDLALDGPLPCDLAHDLSVEIEGLPGRFSAGRAVTGRFDGPGRRVPIAALTGPLPPIDRPGAYRLRVVLTPDPHLGWSDPDVRSIWPAEVATDWAEVRVLRR